MRLLLALLVTTSLSAQSYTIRCTEVADAKTRVLYEATVDGATDFDVVLRDARFEMKAAFSAEGSGPIELRVRIETRRRHGTSSNKLPLWEEDVQQHRLRVRLDQRVELLPFGGAGPRGLLKLDILPRPSPARTPRIDIAKASDHIRVHAHRLPHWYGVRARIEGMNANANALVFARDTARLQVGDATLSVSAEPAPYRDARTSTLVRFDGKWTNGAAFARSWEGITAGQPLRYPIRGPRGEAWTLILEVQPKE
jgi:hypothetical protein